MKSILTLSLFVFFQIQSVAQTIVRYPSGSLSPDLVASNVTATNISLGNGINQVPCSSYVIGSGFDQTSQNNALNNGDYFEFTITPNPGYAITITTVSILTTGSNLVGTPLLERALYYKKQSQAFYMYVAGYNSTSLGTNICSSSSSGSTPAPNVVTTEPITFRLVYYNNTSGVQARIGPVTVSGSIALPIKLSSFAASNIKNSNILNFTTTSEFNNAGFDIERSSDGVAFEKIGWVDGHGNTKEEKQYSFTDTKPLFGINYYRLRQVDYDGRFEYSSIVSTKFESDDRYLFPNPATKEIQVHNAIGSPYQIKSITGKILFQGVLNDHIIDISNLASGTYILYPETGRPMIFNKL
jgi:Secretion system C-terminal sorting domain